MLFLPTRHWKLLGSALALGLVIATWLDGDNGSAMEVVAAAKPDRLQNKAPLEEQSQEIPDGINLEKLRHREIWKSTKDVFAAKSRYVPPPPVTLLLPPSPSPPLLPFSYLGKMVDQGKTMVFLSKQDRNYVVKEGDVIDSTYRVDEIEGSLISLTYMPLNMKQTMQTGEQK